MPENRGLIPRKPAAARTCDHTYVRIHMYVWNLVTDNKTSMIGCKTLNSYVFFCVNLNGYKSASTTTEKCTQRCASNFYNSHVGIVHEKADRARTGRRREYLGESLTRAITIHFVQPTHFSLTCKLPSCRVNSQNDPEALTDHAIPSRPDRGMPMATLGRLVPFILTPPCRRATYV